MKRDLCLFRVAKCHDYKEIKTSQGEMKASQDDMKAELTQVNAKQDEMKAKQDKMRAKQDEMQATQNEIKVRKMGSGWRDGQKPIHIFKKGCNFSVSIVVNAAMSKKCW